VTLEELCTRRVAVWGLGSEGLAMVRLLARRGVVPSLIDDRPEAAQSRLDEASVGAAGTGIADAGVGRRVIGPDQVVWADVDVVVRSPGVSRYRPELASATASGVSVTTAMALWLEDFADARVVAVTGTKGKSTTAALTASLLRQDGLGVALIGNIGVPATDMYDRDPVDAYVVEVSSYQAAEATVTPGVCVLTSLAPDHLDWHGGEEAYYRDKLRLIEVGPPGALAVNAGSGEAMSRTRGHPGRTLFGPSGRVRTTGSGEVVVDDQPLGDATRLALPGRHNAWNLCGAVAGALLLDGRPPSTAAFEAVVTGFEGLPSRCRTVGERGGITFVDDALASNPFATVASIGAFPDRALTVILGGADRGVDPAGLVEALAVRRPAPRVIVLEPDPQRLADALSARSSAIGPVLAVEVARDIEDAVGCAVASTPSGGVVLFSPAAPTVDGEGGFGQRSRRFVAAAGLGAGTPSSGTPSSSTPSSSTPS
jgi:UDP-N-acetylmuramoylalanine--D-glutamate ligase